MVAAVAGSAAGSAALAASEITTNAVKYGDRASPDLQATVTRHGPELTVEVIGTGRFAPGSPLGGPGGFGLRIVAGVSSAWGIEQIGQRVRVWFRFDDVDADSDRCPAPRGFNSP